MRKLLWSFYFFFFAGISSAFAAGIDTPNPKFYTSLAVNTLQTTFNNKTTNKSFNSNRTYSWTLSAGFQTNITNKLYFDLEGFLFRAQSKVLIPYSYGHVKVGAIAGVLPKLGYKINDKFSVYSGLGVGVSYLQTQFYCGSSRYCDDYSLPLNAVFAIGSAYKISQNIDIFAEFRKYKSRADDLAVGISGSRVVSNSFSTSITTTSIGARVFFE